MGGGRNDLKVDQYGESGRGPRRGSMGPHGVHRALETVRGFWLGGVSIGGGSIERVEEKIVGGASGPGRGGYAADKEEGGGWEWEKFGQAGDSGGVLGLIDVRGLGDDKDGSVGGDSGVLEPSGNFGVIGTGHVNDDRGFGGQADAGKEAGFGGAGKGGEENVRGKAAIGERNFRGGGGAECGGDAGDDFEGNVGFAQGLELFGGAAEKERVASLEADDDFVFGGVGEEERIDVLLGEEAEAGALADVNAFGGGGNEVENFRADEGVVKDDIGGLQDAEGFEGEEFGVSGAGAEEEDSGGGVGSFGGRILRIFCWGFLANRSGRVGMCAARWIC